MVDAATTGARKCTIAIVSPFIDKIHGTERHVAECISRLANDYEIHLYSTQVRDVDLSKIFWHPVPAIPGPHLLKYLWWFLANHLWRGRDRWFRELRYDLVHSPGINCFDADVTIVHIVFAEFCRQMRDDLRLGRNPVRSWPRVIHRRLYYRLIRALERRIYPRPSLVLGAVSRKVSEEIQRHFGRNGGAHIIYQGVDAGVFNPEACLRRRAEMRRRFGLAEDAFVLLLIGNGWRNKGLPCLLEAMGKLPDLPLWLLVVGQDDRAPYDALIPRLDLEGRVQFLQPSPDVVQFYAAADAYVGPSRHDSFAHPTAEAMACGLPVITSLNNGGSEIITDGVDGLILPDATDSERLARLLGRLYQDSELRRTLGANAVHRARQLTWDRQAEQLRQLFQEALRRRSAS
jgi:UDP-glucose:(heptosyl)LPS alpha-1,3-glucosyltransferase